MPSPSLTATVINLPDRPDRLHAFLARYHATPLTYVPLLIAPGRPGGDDGCLAAHRNALTARVGPLLVLEDDACFAPYFTPYLNPPPDWDIAWLGGQHRARPRDHDDTWVVPTLLVRTHAYLVREPLKVAALLGHAPRMDPWLSTQDTLRQYCLRRHTVGQCAGTSDIDGSIRPVDEYWNKPFRPLPFRANRG
jgi:hypothetical protein